MKLNEASRFVIASKLPLYISPLKKSLSQTKKPIHVVSNPRELLELTSQISKATILFPHWSWKIPHEIMRDFLCIGFHPTELPFGRGGSPFQNLIRSGYTDTAVTSFLVNEQMDAGDILLQTKFNIPDTNILEILDAYAAEIERQVESLLHNEVIPKKQTGAVFEFPRITENVLDFEKASLKELFNEIRMVDGPGYLPARCDIGRFTLHFRNAKMMGNSLEASIEITERQ